VKTLRSRHEQHTNMTSHQMSRTNKQTSRETFSKYVIHISCNSVRMYSRCFCVCHVHPLLWINPRAAIYNPSQIHWGHSEV